MGRIIIFMGTPGAGKSSVISGISHNFKLINIGTEMLTIAVKEHGIKDRDDMRKLGAEKIKQIRNKVFDGIRTDKSNIILDTHASVRSGPRFVPGFTVDELQSLNQIETIVYVDASSKEIMARRGKDLTRRRDVEDETDLEEQREINLSLIGTYAAIIGIPIYIIKNNDGHLKQALEQANKIATDIFA
ncbi:MAG: AAA family ATPase [Candidatus Micrarchaeales archaeon]